MDDAMDPDFASDPPMTAEQRDGELAITLLKKLLADPQKFLFASGNKFEIRAEAQRL